LPEYSLYLPVIITTPVLPMMARAFAESAKERFQELYGNMLTAVVSVVIPVAVMAIVMPTATVTLLFGPQYASVSRVLPLLALSIVALWVSHATAIAAVAVGLQSHFVRIQLICVATYVVMDWLLIPRAGVMAAGAVRLLTTIIAPLLTYRLVKDAGFRLRVHELRPTLWSGGAMAATVWACSGLPIGLAGTAGVGVYAAALWTGRRLRRAKR
jgi:O-antigen/teichoic acid export membrane protein